MGMKNKWEAGEKIWVNINLKHTANYIHSPVFHNIRNRKNNLKKQDTTQPNCHVESENKMGRNNRAP